MNNEMKEKNSERSGRRAFFAQLAATFAGGLVAGGLLRGLFASSKRVSNLERPVSIKTNPLAVPRTREGSKSNV